MQLLRNPSLELNWLPNSLLKGIPTPVVFTQEEANYGGVYYHPCNKYLNEGKISLKNGAIGIVHAFDRNMGGIIAHEWRHHLQGQHNLLPKRGTIWGEIAKSMTYKEAIVKYFCEQPHEMDALKFELIHGADDINLLWKEWIIAEEELR